jgi:diaminopimelate epimerase
VIGPAADPSHHAALHIFNADGSEAEMSGNGIRCAAAWLLENRPNLERFDIETAAGVRTAEFIRAGNDEMIFRIAMGEPIFDPKRIPFHGEGAVAPVLAYPLLTSLGRREVTVTSMGNPHCSIFVGTFDELDWRSLGREIECHPLFPNRTNVEFIRVLKRTEIEVRFWERGVGETASSGTGSSAAAVASVLNGRTARKLTVKTAGGRLKVEWPEKKKVLLTGPVRRIAQGQFEYHEVARTSRP